MRRMIAILTVFLISTLSFVGLCRADESDVREFFAKDVYGELPPKPATLTFECREGDGVRRRYVIRAEDIHGAWSFGVDVYLPTGRVGRTPVFVYPNFYGNDDLKPQRAPVGDILARGYGFATYCYKDLYPDRDGGDCAADSVWRIFAADKVPTEKLAHPAWAWGGMRVRDLLETLPEVDQGRVAIAGQSRMGKNAAVIGVNDARFSLVCANCGGTKWLKHLPNLKYPSWFSANLRKWVRNDRTGVAVEELEKMASGSPTLPCEQSDYLALIAPRTLVVSAAEQDIWAPAGESYAVWRRTSELMRANGGECLWHVKKGAHSITSEDWSAFMDAADCLWRRSPLAVDLPFRGVLSPRRAGEIRSSNWRLGCETLDRDFADFEAYKGYLAPLGIKTVRLQGGWAKCEKAKGAYDFAWLDRIVDFLVANGMEPAIETDYGNSIYEGGGGCDLAGGFPTGEEALQAWDRWVDALTRHFAGRVKIWMMWNEPDYSIGRKKTPEEIAAFNVRTARIVKRNIPDAKIAGLSLANSDADFLEKCLKPMGADVTLFDWIVYHGYETAPETSYGQVEALKAVLAKYSPKTRLWQGENGCPSERATKFALSGIPWTETSQAKWDLRRMLGDLGHDVESSVFTICDFNHIGREINRKGLLRANADHAVVGPKRAYYAVQNLASVFDDRWTRDRSYRCGDPTLSAYRYVSKEGMPLVVFWTHRKSVEQKGFERPGDSFETHEVPRHELGIEAKDLVWVDLLTGRVYDLPKDRATVPVYDSPCFVTGKEIE